MNSFVFAGISRTPAAFAPRGRALYHTWLSATIKGLHDTMRQPLPTPTSAHHHLKLQT
jgi:hypothetical protein